MIRISKIYDLKNRTRNSGGSVLGVLLLCKLFCLFVSSSNVCADPNITSIEGDIKHDSAITINGIGFGKKTKATPLVWEDFSDGKLDSSLSPHTNSLIANNRDNLRTGFSRFNARNDFKKAGNGFFSYDKLVAPEWFVQYWVKLAASWHWGTSTYKGPDNGLANIKFFRMFPKGSRNYTNFFWNFHGWGVGNNVLRAFENNTSENKYVFNMQNVFTLDTWHCVQVEYGENSGIDKHDGHIKLWIDGILRDDSTEINTNNGKDGVAINKRPYIIGFYDSWPPSDSSEVTQYAYYSDVYVDNTWARVEIGDAPTWSDCTHREMQIPASWSEASIKVNINQGLFAEGDPAYLFVVDSSGNVSRGSPMVIGGDGSSFTASPVNINEVPELQNKEEIELKKDKDDEGVEKIGEGEEGELELLEIPYQIPDLVWLLQGVDLTKHTKGPFTVKIRVDGVDEQGHASLFPRILYYIGTGSSHGYFDMIHEGDNVWSFEIPDPGWYRYRSNSIHYQARLFDEDGGVIAKSRWDIELIDSFIRQN